MMNRIFMRRVLGMLVLAGLVSALPLAARQARVKLATLAPKGTSFHLILQEMGRPGARHPMAACG